MNNRQNRSSSTSEPEFSGFSGKVSRVVEAEFHDSVMWKVKSFLKTHEFEDH